MYSTLSIEHQLKLLHSKLLEVEWAHYESDVDYRFWKDRDQELGRTSLAKAIMYAAQRQFILDEIERVIPDE